MIRRPLIQSRERWLTNSAGECPRFSMLLQISFGEHRHDVLPQAGLAIARGT